MFRYKVVLFVLFVFLAGMLSACGEAVYHQEETENPAAVETAEGTEETEVAEGTEETQNGSESRISLRQETPYLNYQPIERTWERDYTDGEWEQGKCLNVYVMIPDRERQDIPTIEAELNHRLYQAGEDFYIRFYGPTDQEMYEEDRLSERHADELVGQKRREGIPIDIWVTKDYLSAVQKGEVWELTDYLQSSEGGTLYDRFDECVWDQVRVDGEKIYGVSLNPVAVKRAVWSYTPQMTDQLSLDMPSFFGDPTEWEERFSEFLQEGILPVEAELTEDPMMLSLFGLENYGGIIPIRHEDGGWRAVDLWEEEEAAAFYCRLGDWREKGYLKYDAWVLKQLKEVSGLTAEEDLDGDQYQYRLFVLTETDDTSWNESVNLAEGEDWRTATAYAVPDVPAYSSQQTLQGLGVMVISAQTEYPEECMRFLDILFTDPEIRLLLYKGIEGEHYEWKDGVLMNGSAYGFPIGLGFSQDLRFWPEGGWGAKYGEDIEALNKNVSPGAGDSISDPFSEASGLAEAAAACRSIIEEEGRPIFLGYYGDETPQKLEELHKRLIEAGYLELIEAVNLQRPVE